jgi:hypothetical protein
MLKMTTLTFAAVLLTMGLSQPAAAQFKGTASGPNTATSGLCQPGSCAQDGSRRARDITMCSPLNCKKSQTGKSK